MPSRTALAIGLAVGALCLVVVTIAALGIVKANEKPAAPAVSRQARDFSLWPPVTEPGWSQWGHDLHNTHFQPAERFISSANVAQLQVKWVFNSTQYITAQPTTNGDQYLYFAANDKNVYAVNRFSGSVFWQFNVPAFLLTKGLNASNPGFFGAIMSPKSRTSPAIQGNYVYIGTQWGAYAICLNRFTGAVVWSTQLDSHPLAQITASPVAYADNVIFGVSSNEEEAGLALAPYGYKCCTFRGSVVILRASSGQILAKTYTMPDNGGKAGGFAGAGVWGSAFSIDIIRNQVIFATGNQYSQPPQVELCRSMTQNGAVVSFGGHNYSLASVDQRDPCRAAGDLGESIVAARLSDGFVEWAIGFSPVDSYNLACGLNDRLDNLILSRITYFCPQTPGPDVDFSQAPMFIPASPFTSTPHSTDAVYVGQKTGIVYSTSAQAGKPLWAASVGPSGSFGGMQWGSATDGRRVYFHSSNSEQQPQVVSVGGQNVTITYASWGALDAATGQLLWQTPCPTKGFGLATLAVANGILFAGSTDGDLTRPTVSTGGTLYALDASTGAVLWSSALGHGSNMANVLPGDGTVYSVAGYHPFATGGALVAFALPHDTRFHH